MLSADKTFGSFDSAQKPFSFVCVNCVLDVFAVRKQFKIIQSVIGTIKVLMVNFHSFGYRPYKSLPHSAVDSNFNIFSVFARTEPNVMVPRNVRFNRPKLAVSAPSSPAFNVKRRRDAGIQKSSYVCQRRASSKHIFSFLDLIARKTFSSGNATNICQIANFVKAFVAANWFPNLHDVNIKPVYVGSQA